MNRATLSEVLRRWAFRMRKPNSVRKPIQRSPFVEFATLEERAVPSTVPIVSETRQLTASTGPGGSNDVFSRFGAVSATDPNDPQRMVLMYGLATNNGGMPIATDPNTGIPFFNLEGQFTSDGGNNWQPFNYRMGLGSGLPDPANPNDGQLGLVLPFMSAPSVAFARNGRFYVTFTQSNDVARTHGRLMVISFDWTGQGTSITPQQDDTRVIQRWMNQDPIFNPTIAINNNVGTYTDPQTGQVFTDPITNRPVPTGFTNSTPSPLYLAWNTNATKTTNFDGGGNTPFQYDQNDTQFDPNMIYVAASHDNATSFTSPLQVVNGGYFQPVNTRAGGVAPQIFFSPLGGDAGTQGRMFFVWSRTNTAGVSGPTTGILYDTSDPVNTIPDESPLAYSVSFTSGTSPAGQAFTVTSTADAAGTNIGATAGNSNIRDALEPPTTPPPPANTPDTIVRTDFLSDNFDFTSGNNATAWGGLTDLTLTLAINTFDLRHFGIRLFAPDGTSSNLILRPAIKGTDGALLDLPTNPLIPYGIGLRQGNAIRTFGTGITTDANTGGFLPARTFSPGLVISDNAARRITDPANVIGRNEFIGFYRPETGSLTASFSGLSAAQLSGQWKLSIYDIRSDRSDDPGPRNLIRWGLNFSSRITKGLGTDNAGPDQGAALTSGFDFNNNPILNPALDNSTGIGAGVSIAVDNTVGTNSPNRGNVYFAYTTDGGTNTNVRISSGKVLPDGTIAWGLVNNKINNDSIVDNVTEGTRQQFSPALTVDQMNGTLIATWYDARNDAANSRVVRMVGSSIDGGQTFLQTYLNEPKTALDAITGERIVLEPIPDNMTAGVSGPAAYNVGFGLRQSVQAFNGKVHAFWTGNQNSKRADMYTSTVSIAAGPRILEGDSGPITSSLTLTPAADPLNPFTVNTVSVDGSQLLSGFRVVFDRPIQPSTFQASDISVIFRDPNKSGVAPTSTVAVQNPIELTGPGVPNDQVFWIPFVTPQAAIGTYSYAIGPNVRDWVQSPQGSYPTQFPSTPGAPPTPPLPVTKWVVLAPLDNAPPPAVPGLPLPPNTPPAPYSAPLVSNTPVVVSNDGNDNFSAVISAPAITGNSFLPVVGELVVTLNVNHPRLQDLQIFLEDNDGLGISVPLFLNSAPESATQMSNTRISDRAPLAFSSGASPFTGEFRAVGSLAAFAGLPLNVVTNWRLRLVDTNPFPINGQTSTGSLNSWSLSILTGREIDATSPSLGNFMDQDGDGRTLEISGQFPNSNDLFANPRPTGGNPFIAPYAANTQPLLLAGPRFVDTSSPQQMPAVVSVTVSGPTTIDVTFDRAVDRATFDANGRDLASIQLSTAPFTVFSNTPLNNQFIVTPIGNATSVTSFRITLPAATIPNAVYTLTFRPDANLRTADNLVYNTPTDNVTVTFDRDMDPASFTPASIVRMTGPTGDIAGPFTVDPIPGDLRSFRVGFPTQVLSGQYTIEFAPAMRAAPGSVGGALQVDTNLNAGLQVLRGVDPNAAAYVVNSYATTAPPVTIPAQGVISLPIDVPDSFIISQLIGSTRSASSLIQVRLNITHPNTPDLIADLIAPNGTRIRLFTSTGTNGIPPLANFTSTALDDLGVSSIQNGNPPFTFGPYTPQFPLSSLNGLSSLGVGPNAWRLEITNNGNSTGTFTNWGISLPTTVLGDGLGETIADRFTASFRIYQNQSNNPLSQQVWAPTSPTQVTVTTSQGTPTVPVAGRANTVAVDPSDASGNTVYVGGASGGVWKTTNFLTLDPEGPTWTPLTDFGPTFGLNISHLLVIPRNNDPNQSIIIASTGAGGLPGSFAPVTNGSTLPQLTGVGLLRSMNGGRTWSVLDSTANGTGVADNVLPIDAPQGSSAGQRNRTFFNANIFKVIADPTPTPSGNRILYMAVSGNAAQQGVWRSVDTGLTWTRIQTGNATDVALAAGSGVNSPTGNLTILYAGIAGQGVFFTSQATTATSMTNLAGGGGTPSVRHPDTTEMQVDATTGNPVNPGGLSLQGKISLAVPTLTNDPLQNSFYAGWVYAYVTTGSGDASLPTVSTLFLSRDFGLNWTRVLLPQITDPLIGTFGTNNETRTPFNIFSDPVRTSPQITGQSGVGNNTTSIAVDPQNPNIVYLGGISSLRVDTTKVNTPQTFVNFDNSRAGDVSAIQTATSGGMTVAQGLFLPGSTLFTYPDDFLNLRRFPNVQVGNSTASPFDLNATLRVTSNNPNYSRFTNSGENAQVTPFNNILNAGLGTFSFSDITQIVPMVDPVTGQTRLLFSTRFGLVSAVDSGETRGTGTLTTNVGFYQLPGNNRNGNLDLQRFYSGAVQPSVLAADLASAFYYGMGQDTGFLVSPSDILNNGDLNWAGTISNASTGIGVAVDQTGSGSSYQYRLPCCYNTSGPNGSITPTDFFRVYDPGTNPAGQGVSRTLGLIQVGDNPANGNGQWPFNRQDVGYFTVNPIDGNGMIISSQVGRVFRTVNKGAQWFPIYEPGFVPGLPSNPTYARALAYGAPDPAAQVPGEFNNFIYIGTQNGRVLVTTVGGGPTGWTDITPGGVVGPILAINANPRRGSTDAFVVTPTQVWYIPDSRDTTIPWINVTGNLFSLRTNIFGDPNTTGVPPAGSLPFDIRTLTTIIADWRYAIPVNPGNPNSETFPILYVGANAGVFRSLDRGATWSFFPEASTYTEPVSNVAVNIPSGGFLPNTWVTDLDLSLGNIDPLTGLPVAQTGSPNMLVATTWGRGTWTIRLDDPLPQFRITDLSGPRVVAMSTTNPSNSLRVRFDGPVDPTSFSAADIVLKAPSGVVIPITAVTPVINPNQPQASDRRDLFEFSFPTQTEVGFYTVLIGPDIIDFSGRQMNQNGNLINGEAEDAYGGFVYLNPPSNIQGNMFISLPMVTRAGDPTPITISAIEGSSTGPSPAGNPLASFNKTISISTTDGAAIIPTSYTYNPVNDKGSKAFSFEFRTAGVQFITVVDTSNTLNQAKAQILVRGGQAVSYVVNGFPNPTIAGGKGDLTVTAKDAFGNIADGYTGTVTFTSTDSLATLPADTTFQASDNGVRVFNDLVLRSAGVRSIIATDTAKSTISGSQVGIIVNPDVVSKYVISGLPATVPAGKLSTVTVAAQDQFGNVNPSYLGTVAFSSNDLQVAPGNGLPTNYTFQASDNGIATFTNGVVLKTAGTKSVTATDTVNPSITGSQSTLVTAAAATGFSVTVSPTSPVAGVGFTMIVSAVDQFGNIDKSFTGPVTFSSTDKNATLPGNYSFVAGDNGSKTFTGVILRTAGPQTITSKDPNTGVPTGTSPTINVQANVATQLFVVDLPATTQVGVPTSFAVVAKDAFGNVAPTYRGTVQFTVDDPQISLGKYSFQAADNGQKILPVTFKSAGLKTITATDFNSPALTGKASTLVEAGLFAKIGVTELPPAVTAGVPAQFRVSAQDAFGNTVAGYLGTVTFTSTDPLLSSGSGLPIDYSFVPGDKGTALFTATLKTAGVQGITVTDTSVATATGSQLTNVSPGALSFFSVGGFPNPTIVGKSGKFTVTAQDAFGNTLTNYTGKVNFTSTDPAASLPGVYTFATGDAGTRTFSATLNTPGLQSITVRDTTQTSVTGSQLGITVNAVPPPPVPTGGTASGIVFNDVNGNGVRDAGEVGLPNVVVFLDSNGDGLITGEISTTTNAAGAFSLSTATDTVAGLRIVVPAGQTQTTLNPPASNLTGANTVTGILFGLQTSTVVPPPPVPPVPGVPPPPVPGVPPPPGPIAGNGRAPSSTFSVGTGGGAGNVVSIYDQSGNTIRELLPYAQTSEGGTRPAIQRTPQGERVIVAPGKGGIPDVLIFDVNGGNLLRTLQPFESTFTGGYFIATGDIDNDGYDDVVISADVGGGPRVQVLDGKTLTVKADFLGIEDPNFRGGARTTLGDFNGDGTLDLAVAAGFGGGPRVAIFDGRSLVPGQQPQRMVSDFFVFEQTLRNGVYIGAGDITGDGRAELVLGGGPGGGPRVQIFSGGELLQGEFNEVANFFAGNPENRGGVRLAVKNLDGDPFMDLVVGDGEGAGSRVTAYTGQTLGSSRPSNPLFAFDELAGYLGGVFVG